MDFFTKVALPVYIGGQVLDGWTTLAATRSGAGTEANPFMGSGGPANVAIKGGVAVLAGYLLKRHAQEHPKLASGLAIGLGAGLGAIGVHNASLLRRK